ncbi:hypothetical protein VIBNISO65_110021 [Vibrio nigripulchritudo SO65]|nr:hypothetical protein VIBNIFTn2_210091 [Vibrio nigripulchritudo FTn2]CCN66361.1 hypothetical protein VIBNIPon4_530151 [Vibrio nigripulchritudo POn4]CCN74452.1 hypothetical protein VIBNISO65_110021 [Vibrio nigripulchritudo SO65]
MNFPVLQAPSPFIPSDLFQYVLCEPYNAQRGRKIAHSTLISNKLIRLYIRCYTQK